MKQNGFSLLEVLIASAILSLGSAGFSKGLSDSFKTAALIRKSDRQAQLLSLSGQLIEKDLLKAVKLRAYPFEGNKTRLKFPILEKGLENDVPEIKIISYEFENESLVRREIKTFPGGEKKKIIQPVKKGCFFYPYIDHDEKTYFHEYWQDDPYIGFPRCVQMTFHSGDLEMSKIISIPQGKWAFALDEEKHED